MADIESNATLVCVNNLKTSAKQIKGLSNNENTDALTHAKMREE